MPRRPSSHVDDPVAVGRRLRKAREAAGLTQRELSFEGCTAAYVSRIEAGARVPSLQILREFGKRLGVSADYLATGHDGIDDLSSDLLEAEMSLELGDERRAVELYEAAREGAESPAALARAQLGLGRLALRSAEIAGRRRFNGSQCPWQELRGAKPFRRSLRPLPPLPRRGA
jgi:transcriptional regulator with XRE-family HTH domain